MAAGDRRKVSSMENEFLFDIAEKYFKDKNVGNRKWNFMTFWYGEYIPEKQLQSAKKWFAGYNPNKEEPIIIMMDNCFGLIKEGLVVTNINIYYIIETFA
jgi:hypothetical protein